MLWYNSFILSNSMMTIAEKCILYCKNTSFRAWYSKTDIDVKLLNIVLLTLPYKTYKKIVIIHAAAFITTKRNFLVRSIEGGIYCKYEKGFWERRFSFTNYPSKDIRKLWRIQKFSWETLTCLFVLEKYASEKIDKWLIICFWG